MGLRFEAWTLPTSGTFEKKFDVVDAISGSGVRALSEYSDESLSLPSSSDLIDSIVTDTEGSWIRVYDGSKIVDEFRADRVAIPEARPSVRQISGPQRNGLVEGIAIYPKNWPEDKENAQDWEWGYTDIMPDLSLGALGSIREEWEVWHDHTSGSWNAAVDGDNNDIAHDASASDVEGRSETLDPPGTGLQGLTTVDDVTVDGAGTADDPYVIVFYDPPAPGTVSFTVGTLAGGTTFSATRTVTGALDPSPITISKPLDQGAGGDEHGVYGEPPIQVVTDNLDTGADWALRVNAWDRFAGSQIVLDVEPGKTYSNINVRVKPTVSGAGDFTLVLHDVFENKIKNTTPRDVTLAAGSYQDLTIDTVTIPPGVNQIIMRVATTDASLGSGSRAFYVNWQGATFFEGAPEATFTQIIGELLDAAHDRGTATFLERDATDAADSNGTALDPISFAAFFGGNAHLGHVLGDGAQSGYAWRVVDAANAKVITPTGSHVLQIFKATNGEIEDQTSSAGGASITVGGKLENAETVRRIPPYTTILSHGAGALTREDTDATAETNMGRIERVFDAEPLGTDTELSAFNTSRFAEESANRKAASAVVLESDSSRPLVDYEEGSKVWWNFGSNLPKEARVVKRIAWTHGNVARYEVQGSSRLTPEAAMAKAVDHLLNQPVRRRGQGGGLKASDLQALTEKGAGTILIAASDASPIAKAAAWKVCDGTDDQEEWNAAIVYLSQYGGGEIIGSEGTFSITGPIQVNTADIGIRLLKGVFSAAANSINIFEVTASETEFVDVRIVNPTGTFTGVVGCHINFTTNDTNQAAGVVFERYRTGILSKSITDDAGSFAYRLHVFDSSLYQNTGTAVIDLNGTGDVRIMHNWFVENTSTDIVNISGTWKGLITDNFLWNNT